MVTLPAKSVTISIHKRVLQLFTNSFITNHHLKKNHQDWDKKYSGKSRHNFFAQILKKLFKSPIKPLKKGEKINQYQQNPSRSYPYKNIINSPESLKFPVVDINKRNRKVFT